MFDSNGYRKDVLKPLLDDGQSRFDDVFMVFGLDPATDDKMVIQTRIDEVVAFWRKEQSSPRYKGLVTLLLRERDHLSAQLLDDRLRGECRERVLASRASESQAKFAQLDEMLATLDRRMGGIPASRIERLRATAKRAGLTDVEFDARLASQRILDDEEVVASPPPASVRQQARSLLAEHARLQEGPQAAAYRTLFDFLGASPTSSRDAFRQAADSIAARNRQRRHDRLRTVVDELLALATDLLIEADPASYVAGLVEDIGDQLRDQIERAVLLEDKLTPFEFERLLGLAITSGLEPDPARSLVVRVAREVGAPIETGAAVEYVVCGTCAMACGTDVPRGLCPSCGADLFRTCPGCGSRLNRSAPRCQSCQLDVRALGEAEGELSAVRAALAEGHLMDARGRVEALGSWAGTLSEVTDLQRSVDAALAEAGELWRRVLDLLRQTRFDDAKHVVAQLSERASDVSGPNGETLREVAKTIDAALDDIERRVASASGLDDAERESAILALADEFPAAATVLAALRSLPVAAPSRVVVMLGEGAIKVAWKASPSRGSLSYRVFRTIHTDQGDLRSQPVGSTSDTSIEDAGVAGGQLASYEVLAVRHGIASGAAATSPLLAAFDVERLVAIEHDAAIELRWSRIKGEAGIWAERTDLTDPSVPTRRMRAGESGVLDTDVVAHHHYSYRVFIEYPSTSGVVATRGRQVEATATVIPPPPAMARLTTRAGSIRIEPESFDDLLVALRLDAPPTHPRGAIVDDRQLMALGRQLGSRDGVFTDVADGTIRWYLLASTFGSQAVVGDATMHPGFDEPSDVIAADEVGGVVLRWRWPMGCTEAMVIWRADSPPASASDPAATSRKVTNMAYELADGWRLPSPPPGELHFLVRPARRFDNRIITMPGGPPEARTSHKSAVLGELSYRLRRSGRRKRNLEVELIGGVEGRPDLVVVGRAGTAAPLSADDGEILGRFGSAERSLAMSVDDLTLPMVIALFPTHSANGTVRVDHPTLEERTLT